MNEIVQFIRDNNWAAIIKERQESGLTIKQWCAENNVSEGAYYYRLKRLRAQLIRSVHIHNEDLPAELPVNNAPPAPAFVRVPDSVTSTGSFNAALQLRKGGTIIEVSNDASDGILALMKEVMLNA